MTGPEHYRAAESWLIKAEKEFLTGRHTQAEACACIANVHATLGLVAHMINADNERNFGNVILEGPNRSISASDILDKVREDVKRVREHVKRANKSPEGM